MIDGPYKLPKGWRWVRLGEVCIYERQTIDPRRYPHQEFLLFSIPAYDNNKQPELRKGSEIRSSKLKIKPNICLFSKLNPRIPRAWVIKSDESISDLPMLASTEFLALRPHTHLIDLDYLGLCLLSNVFLSQFQVGLTGATSSRQRLKQEDVLNALLPLPPLEEQKRIVARIEELMDKIKEAKKLRQETKKQTELLWQSILAETFPQPGTQLPNGWRWVRLGEVCSKPQYGLTQSASTTPVGPKFLRITDITSGSIDWEKVPYCRISQHELDKYKLDEGDLLFARSGSIGATILIKEKPPYDAVFASYLIRVRLNKFLVYPEFLYWFTRSPSGQEQLIPRGATQKNINAKFIQSLLIPLPPLDEQKRIVARVEELMSKIKEVKRLRKETKKQTELLWQSVLAETFPQTGTQLPNGWRWVRLSEITKDLESGKRPKGGVKNIANGIPSIGGEHITWDGGFDFAKIRYVPYEFYQSMRKGKINKGDILIVKDGATTGKTAYVSEDFPFKDACINEHVYILRVYENLAISRFVFLFLISSSGQNQIKNTFRGAAQGGINSEFINQVTIPLPPLEEQKRIANYLQEVHEKIKELKEVQTRTEEEIKFLEQSILEKAFRGEL